MLADDVEIAGNRPRSILVVGGASGIGQAICEVLARDGHRIVVADIDEVRARAVADSVDGTALHVDVTDEKSVVALFERAVEVLGRLDGLATAAGVSDATPLLALDAASFARVYAVNAVGTFLCIREAAKRMSAGDRICTVAGVSLASHVRTTAAYAASAAAVVALTRSSARDLAPLGIGVNGIVPGPAGSDVRGLGELAGFLLSVRAASFSGAILDDGHYSSTL